MTFQQILFNIKQVFGKKSIIYSILISTLIIIISTLFLFLSGILNPSLNTQNLSDYSKVISGKTTNYFIVQKDDGYIYKSSKTGIDAVREFINKNPSFNGTRLLPLDFARDSDLTRSEKDSKDKFLKSKNINISNEHYFFEQKINNIPVYGSSLAVHLRNNSEIYSVFGNLIKTKIITEQKISEDQARQVALNDALKDVPTVKEFKIMEAKKYIINKKILGLSDDETNYLALGIQIDSSDIPFTFSTLYFINLENGELLYRLSKVIDLLDRQIYSCSGSNCPLVRSEGQPPVNDPDADNAYDFFGDTFNFYFNNFQRDSYDNRGAIYKGYVHASLRRCPNASWNRIQMNFCSGMVTKDITAHELTHAVIQYTANLQYNKQSGALNESISDIFGYAVDNTNWTLGEGSVMGIIRYIDDPPRKGQPDRLFSSLYYCGTTAEDYGGVHKNSGVMNKAFYLMTDGGSFNGCSTTGVGRDKSVAIVYQTLTRYLTSTSNFKAMYNSILQACNDLYSSGSSDCENVKNALQATEMDQQPDNSQAGAYCQGIQRKTPACAGGSPAPTTPISPTVTLPPGVSLTPTVTSTPTKFSISIHVYIDKNNSGSEDSGDTPYEGATVELTGDSVKINGITDRDGNLSLSDLTRGYYIVKISIQNYNIAPYPINITDRDVSLSLRLSPKAPLTPPVIITLPIIPTPTLTPVPTNSSLPTGGSGGLSPAPTPTPITTFNCILDPKCISGQKNLQFCPLICTPK